MYERGHSLLEVMVASSILTVVSLLGFIVVKSSNETAQLTTAKAEVQNNLRDSMAALVDELREGVTVATTELTGAPEDLAAVSVEDDGKRIVFQIPAPEPGATQIAYSTPVSFTLENEDENGNGRLDAGEDENGDGALTRRIVRVQDGAETPVAGATTIDDVTFTLLENQAEDNDNLTTVRIQMAGSKRYGAGDGKLVLSQMESVVRLVN